MRVLYEFDGVQLLILLLFFVVVRIIYTLYRIDNEN